MKKLLSLVLSLVLAASFISCKSSTVIRTEPEGADVYIDGIHVGKTPYEYSDIYPVFTETKLSISKPGYVLINTNLNRDEKFDPRACLGCIFTFPWWMFQYHPARSYKLEREDKRND